MKKLLNFNIKYLYIFFGLVTVVFLVECGFTALTADVPDSANAGSVATFTLNTGVEPRVVGAPYVSKLLVGVMVPRNWKGKDNTTLSLSSPKGNGVLLPIPDSEIDPTTGLNWSASIKKRFGIGPNLIDDFEWIIFRSVNNYSFNNNEDFKFDVTVKSKVGNENILVKLGFYIGSSAENLRQGDQYYNDYNKVTFSNTFEVKNGQGDLIDFVNPQLSKIEPVKSLDNDIVTFYFDAGVTPTDLSNTDDIYLCAKAFDQNNQEIAICEQTAKTKLTATGGKKYRIDLWPRGFFNALPLQVIKRIEYYYTDVTGTKKVGYANNVATPFKYTFTCQ